MSAESRRLLDKLKDSKGFESYQERKYSPERAAKALSRMLDRESPEKRESYSELKRRIVGDMLK